MTPRRRLRATAAALIMLGSLAGILAPASHADTGLVDVMATIPMTDGVTLAGETVTAAGPGPHPLIVMPGSWGSNQLQYHSIALLFGGAGYDVVGYSDRGMATSQGVADYADTATVSDVSTVIDFAVQHLAADAGRVGVLGISYGGGVGLLAAERDPRIKAVAALSAWTDFDDTFLPSGSIASDLIRGLALSTTGTAPHVRLGPQTSPLFAEYQTDPAAARKLIRRLAATRSPVLGAAALSNTAVLLANGMQDSLLPPRQLVGMFGALRGPKKLELRTGDHGQPEAAALYGTDETTGPVADALTWMDHYLRGKVNGIATAPPVTLTDTITGVTTGYPRWPGKGSVIDPLGTPATPTSDPAQVAIGQPDADTWTRDIPWGLNTPAETAYEQTDFTNPYRIPTVAAASFSSYFSYLWNGAEASSAKVYAGSPTLTLTVAASQPAVSMVAYLYDVNSAGSASFMTVAPMTVSGLKAGLSKSVTFTFQPIAWTILAGHHLELVVDSADHRWTSSNVPQTTLEITSTATMPAELRLPIP